MTITRLVDCFSSSVWFGFVVRFGLYAGRHTPTKIHS